MSAHKQAATIARSYEPAPDDCIRALELLLKAPVHKEEGGSPTALNEATKGSKRDRPAS